MAKKNDQNEDPEENKKKQFDDDEDFGLPDLEYDALEDDSMGDDEPIDEDLEAEIEAEVEVSGSEAAAKSGKEEVSLDGDDWEKELEKELEDDLKSGKFQEDVEAFYEEESYSDFETEETVKSSVFGIDAKEEKPIPPKPTKAPETKVETKKADTKFVEDDLPYVAPPKPKPTPTPVKPTANKDYVSYYKENKSGKSNFARTVVIGILLFTVVAIIFLALYKKPADEAPKVVEKTPPPVEQKEEPVVEPVVDTTPKPAQVVAGQISRLDQKTGKTYVIIASFFDGDMAQDHANALSAAGKSPYIIPPFNDYRFYRVAIAEFETFNDAKTSLEGYKSEYGADVWPLRY